MDVKAKLWMLRPKFEYQRKILLLQINLINYSLGLLLALDLEVSEIHNIEVIEMHNIEVSENIKGKKIFVVSKIYLVGVRQRSLEVSNLACKG